MPRELTKDNLYNFYIVEGHSRNECLIEFGINSIRVLKNYFKKFGIKKLYKDSERTVWISEKDLYKAYIEDNLTRNECAELFNTSKNEIAFHIKHYNIIKDISLTNKAIWRLHHDEIAASHLGIHQTEEAKQKISNTFKNKTSEEKADRAQKISKASKEMWQNFSSEEYENICKNISIGMTNMSDSEKESRISKIVSTKNSHEGGYCWWMATSEYRSKLPEIVEKRNKTRIKNGTYGTSKPEENYYNDLVKLFGTDGVIRQYSDERYPFRCDFYIPSEDLFIEYNGHISHGPHPFDPNSEEDLKLLDEIRSKQGYRVNSEGKLVKNSYYIYEETWTKRDVNKLSYAIKNSLNYIAEYKEGSYFPNGPIRWLR